MHDRQKRLAGPDVVTGAMKSHPTRRTASDRQSIEAEREDIPTVVRRLQAKAKARPRRRGMPSPSETVASDRNGSPESFDMIRKVRARPVHEAMPATSALSPRRHRSSIEIRQLRYFVAAVESGSLRSAESRIGVSQPAMTRQIHQLEEELGVELLVRRSRGIRPTDAGQVLFEDAVRILAMLECALQRVRRVLSHDSGSRSQLGEPISAARPWAD